MLFSITTFFSFAYEIMANTAEFMNANNPNKKFHNADKLKVKSTRCVGKQYPATFCW